MRCRAWVISVSISMSHIVPHHGEKSKARCAGPGGPAPRSYRPGFVRCPRTAKPNSPRPGRRASSPAFSPFVIGSAACSAGATMQLSLRGSGWGVGMYACMAGASLLGDGAGISLAHWPTHLVPNDSRIPTHFIVPGPNLHEPFSTPRGPSPGACQPLNRFGRTISSYIAASQYVPRDAPFAALPPHQCSTFSTQDWALPARAMPDPSSSAGTVLRTRLRFALPSRYACFAAAEADCGMAAQPHIHPPATILSIRSQSGWSLR